MFRAISRIFKTTKTVNFRDDLFSTKRRQRITTRTQKGYKGQSITRNAMCHVSTFWREQPHLKDLPVHVRSQRGLDIVENPGINLAQNWADPRKLLTSD